MVRPYIFAEVLIFIDIDLATAIALSRLDLWLKVI
jgi:hypothetical protein